MSDRDRARNRSIYRIVFYQNQFTKTTFSTRLFVELARPEVVRWQRFVHMTDARPNKLKSKIHLKLCPKFFFVFHAKSCPKIFFVFLWNIPVRTYYLYLRWLTVTYGDSLPVLFSQTKLSRDEHARLKIVEVDAVTYHILLDKIDRESYKHIYSWSYSS